MSDQRHLLDALGKTARKHPFGLSIVWSNQGSGVGVGVGSLGQPFGRWSLLQISSVRTIGGEQQRKPVQLPYEVVRASPPRIFDCSFSES